MWPETVAYFVVDQPTKTSQWVNGAANPITWTKGLLDGVDTIDLELARLSSDGLIFVARNGPSLIDSPPAVFLTFEDFHSPSKV